MTNFRHYVLSLEKLWNNRRVLRGFNIERMNPKMPRVSRLVKRGGGAGFWYPTARYQSFSSTDPVTFLSTAAQTVLGLWGVKRWIVVRLNTINWMICKYMGFDEQKPNVPILETSGVYFLRALKLLCDGAKKGDGMWRREWRTIERLRFSLHFTFSFPRSGSWCQRFTGFMRKDNSCFEISFVSVTRHQPSEFRVLRAGLWL